MFQLLSYISYKLKKYLSLILFYLPKVQKKLKIKNNIRQKKAKFDNRNNLNVNIGSGTRNFENFINIDLCKKNKPDICCDITIGLPFKKISLTQYIMNILLNIYQNLVLIFLCVNVDDVSMKLGSFEL